MEGNAIEEVRIFTRRLTLVPMSSELAPLQLDYAIRNRTFLAPWEPVRHELFYRLETQEQMIGQDVRAMAAGQMFKVAIFKREQPDRMIGTASLSNIVGGAFQSCHLGYRLDHEELGNGYMTEAVQALVEFAFRTLRLHRVEANVMPRNVASRRVVEKLGFAEEGLARKYLKINGVWEDHVHWVILNEELESQEE